MKRFVTRYRTVVQTAVDADFLFFTILLVFGFAAAVFLSYFIAHLFGPTAGLVWMIVSFLLLPGAMASICIAALGLRGFNKPDSSH